MVGNEWYASERRHDTIRRTHPDTRTPPLERDERIVYSYPANFDITLDSRTDVKGAFDDLNLIEFIPRCSDHIFSIYYARPTYYCKSFIARTREVCIIGVHEQIFLYNIYRELVHNSLRGSYCETTERAI